MEIFTTPRYTRALAKFLKKHPDYHPLITHRLYILRLNPNHPQLHLHKLINRENEYAISVDHSIRIIFHRDQDVCYLLGIGSHDEVY